MKAIEKINLHIIQRLRRNRRSEAIRSLVRETVLTAHDLVMPFFIIPGFNKIDPIPNFPGMYRMSADKILEKAIYLFKKKVQAISLFPVIEKDKKSLSAKEALNRGGLVPETIQFLKKEIPDLCLITDIALDPFTTHGHDGLVQGTEILNDETLEMLAQMALIHAEAGADIVAPSDMMDGRISYIRNTLDAQGFASTGILSYSAKYASSLYDPFRYAVNSTLLFGDKKTYQMDPANRREALLEAKLDEEEGADILMVKPATIYLDVISKLRDQTQKPIAAYHVSGEYAMVKAADKLGYINGSKVFYETLLSIKRAGASLIFSYAAEEILDMLN